MISFPYAESHALQICRNINRNINGLVKFNGYLKFKDFTIFLK